MSVLLLTVALAGAVEVDPRQRACVSDVDACVSLAETMVRTDPARAATFLAIACRADHAQACRLLAGTNQHNAGFVFPMDRAAALGDAEAWERLDRAGRDRVCKRHPELPSCAVPDEVALRWTVEGPSRGRLAFSEDHALWLVDPDTATGFGANGPVRHALHDGPSRAGTVAAVDLSGAGPWAVVAPDPDRPHVTKALPETALWTADGLTWLGGEHCEVPSGWLGDAWVSTATTTAWCSDGQAVRLRAPDGSVIESLDLPKNAYKVATHRLGGRLTIEARKGVWWQVGDGFEPVPLFDAIGAASAQHIVAKVRGRWTLFTYAVADGELTLGAAVHTFEDAPREVAFSPDGRRVAVSDSAGVHVRSTRTGKVQGPTQREVLPRDLTWSADGRFVAWQGKGAVALWPVDGASPVPLGPAPAFAAPGDEDAGTLRCQVQLHSLPGVPVRVGFPSRTEEEAQERTTGPDGLAMFDDIPCGRVRFEAEGDYQFVHAHPGEVVRARPPYNNLTETVSVRGLDGAPAVGVPVQMLSNGRYVTMGVTDERGVFDPDAFEGRRGEWLVETEEGVGATRFRRGLKLRPREGLWHFEVRDFHGRPVDVRVGEEGRGQVDADGRGWLLNEPEEALRVSVFTPGNFVTLAPTPHLVLPGTVLPEPAIPEGIDSVAFVDRLGQRVTWVVDDPSTHDRRLVGGPGQVVMTAGERCGTQAFEVHEDTPLPAPELAKRQERSFRAVDADGAPNPHAFAARYHPPSIEHDPSPMAVFGAHWVNAMGEGTVPDCGEEALWVVGDRLTDTWGFVVDGVAATTLPNQLRAAVAIGDGGLVVLTSTATELLPGDVVETWDGAKTKRWTWRDFAPRVWHATEAVEVTYRREVGGETVRGTALVPAPAP